MEIVPIHILNAICENHLALLDEMKLFLEILSNLT